MISYFTHTDLMLLRVFVDSYFGLAEFALFQLLGCLDTYQNFFKITVLADNKPQSSLVGHCCDLTINTE